MKQAVAQRVTREGRVLITPAVLIAFVAAVLLIASTSSSPALTSAATSAGIYVVLAVALYTFSGTSGVLSFGHMGMMAIGGYTAAILATSPELKISTFADMPSWAASSHTAIIPAILIGGLVAALFAALVSIPLVRLRGLAASLATFAVLVVVNNVATNWSALTGGVTGYNVVPIETTTKGATVWACLAIIAAFLFSRSRVGLRLRSSREDEMAALGAGANVRMDRGIAFVFSGFLAGVGGALTALQLGVVTPSVFYLDTTFLIIVMIVVGGMSSLSGAVVGAILISAVRYVLQLVQSGDVLGIATFSGRAGIQTTGLALVALLVLKLRPNGLLGSSEISDLVRRRPGRRPQPVPEDDTEAGVVDAGNYVGGDTRSSSAQVEGTSNEVRRS